MLYNVLQKFVNTRGIYKMKEKPSTKLCKHCKTEIPYTAKVCPNCRKKQSSVLKWVGIVFVALIVISAIGGGGDKKESATQTASGSNNETNTSETNNTDNKSESEEEQEEQKEIEYISVTATELSDALANNAMKAENDYKGKYLEVSGTLGNIDSSGKYIGIDSDKDFDFTNIQCYLKTDEQKEIIMEMSKGDTITVKGYCKDMGEILGYQIDIEEIVK